MKKLGLAILLTFLAVPGWAKSYYLAPAAAGGSDSNSGLTTGVPWLTPNHAVNCGDTITAAASSAYSAANFAAGKWGRVTRSAGNSVAWLMCATFNTCKISASGFDGMRISSSYWGVQGWEATVISGSWACFSATPPGGATIHHIIFANDIANGCFANGFTTYNNGNASVDYIAFVGNVAYNAAQGTQGCYSGISIYQPVQSDSLTSTISMSRVISFRNVDPSPFGGVTPTDGDGIILDTFDGSQGRLHSPYAAQTVIENNFLIFNGGRGLEIFNSRRGSSHAPIYARQNTLWGNNGAKNQSASYCGEVLLSLALDVEVSSSLAATNAAKDCGANPIYTYYAGFGDATDIVHNTMGYSAGGTYEGTVQRAELHGERYR